MEFFKVKPETIEFFDEIGKLHYIGIKIINRTFGYRVQGKNHKDAISSPLFETPAVSTSDWMLDQIIGAEQFFDVINFESEIQTNFKKAKKAISEALNSSSNQSKEPSDYLKVRVFLDVTETNISQVSKRIGVDRKYIRRFYKEGQQLLKDKIND